MRKRIYLGILTLVMLMGIYGCSSNKLQDNELKTDDNIEIVVAKEHQNQLEDKDVKKEVESLSKFINEADLDYVDNTVNFVFVKGQYQQSENEMMTTCLFVNKTNEELTEIHGKLRLKFTSHDASIATSTLDFDESFLGVLKPNQALLVHLNIPVRGLLSDEELTIEDIQGSFDDVKIKIND